MYTNPYGVRLQRPPHGARLHRFIVWVSQYTASSLSSLVASLFTPPMRLTLIAQYSSCHLLQSTLVSSSSRSVVSICLHQLSLQLISRTPSSLTYSPCRYLALLPLTHRHSPLTLSPLLRWFK